MKRIISILFLLPAALFSFWGTPQVQDKAYHQKMYAELIKQQLDNPHDQLINYNIGVAAGALGLHDVARDSFERAADELEYAFDDQITFRAHLNSGALRARKAIGELEARDWMNKKIEKNDLARLIDELYTARDRYDNVDPERDPSMNIGKIKNDLEAFAQQVKKRQDELNKQEQEKKEQEKKNDKNKQNQDQQDQSDSDDQQDQDSSDDQDQQNDQSGKPDKKKQNKNSKNNQKDKQQQPQDQSEEQDQDEVDKQNPEDQKSKDQKSHEEQAEQDQQDEQEKKEEQKSNDEKDFDNSQDSLDDKLGDERQQNKPPQPEKPQQPEQAEDEQNAEDGQDEQNEQQESEPASAQDAPEPSSDVDGGPEAEENAQQPEEQAGDEEEKQDAAQPAEQPEKSDDQKQDDANAAGIQDKQLDAGRQGTEKGAQNSEHNDEKAGEEKIAPVTQEGTTGGPDGQDENFYTLDAGKPDETSSMRLARVMLDKLSDHEAALQRRRFAHRVQLSSKQHNENQKNW